MSQLVSHAGAGRFHDPA